MDDRNRLLALLMDINEDVDFKTETALVDEGLIDSLDLTHIIAGLSDVFGVRVTPGDIEPENFNNVDAMLALVQRCRARQ
ncbi:MAG: acyl carrier protein [Oscillospiraceae bacterium]|jgi:acyl carrier protein|nr:acyl carrier protein [Oscillospiraceae bacterium]